MTAEVRDVPSRTGQVSGPSFRGRMRDFSDRHRSISVIVGMTIAAGLLPIIILIPPFSGFSNRTRFPSNCTCTRRPIQPGGAL